MKREAVEFQHSHPDPISMIEEHQNPSFTLIISRYKLSILTIFTCTKLILSPKYKRMTKWEGTRYTLSVIKQYQNISKDQFVQVQLYTQPKCLVGERTKALFYTLVVLILLRWYGIYS